VELQGQLVTLYPLSLEGGVVAPGTDPTPAVGAFQSALVSQLVSAGMDVRMPVPGTPDMAIVIRPQLLLADPGSRLMRYLFTWFAGAAKFEAGGAIGNSQAPVAQIAGKGVRRAGVGGGDSVNLLTDAGKLAGTDMGRQIVDLLRSR
jgi:hypothetical protein